MPTDCYGSKSADAHPAEAQWQLACMEHAHARTPRVAWQVDWLGHELRELDPRAALYVTRVMAIEVRHCPQHRAVSARAPSGSPCQRIALPVQVEYYKRQFALLEPHKDESGAQAQAIEGAPTKPLRSGGGSLGGSLGDAPTAAAKS